MCAATGRSIPTTMLIRATITLILTLSFFLLPQIGYTSPYTILPHLLYPLSHANIFHLLCNLIALWSIKGNLHLTTSIIISFFASYFPTISLYPQTLPTMGFSAILCATIGIKWGIYFHTPHSRQNLIYNAKRFAIYIITPLLICAIIPNINFSLHLYSLLIALIISPLLTPHHQH